MKKIKWYQAKGAIQYPSHFYRLLWSFFAAQLVVLYGDKHTLEATLANPYYHMAWLASMAIAYVVINFVFWMTSLLDQHYPWGRSYRLRLPRQLMAGVVVPLLPAALLAAGYFAYFKISIFETVYFSRYLQQIIFMLISLNAYLFYSWALQNRSPSTRRALLENLTCTQISKDKYQDIACIFIEGKDYFALRFSGEKIVWDDSLLKSLNYLNSAQFYMVNRGFIANRAAIMDVKISSPKNTKLLLNLEKMPEVNVSQRENVNFKKWLVNRLY